MGVEILADFIFTQCVFFSRALGVYRTQYADATEITPSTSKSAAHRARFQGTGLIKFCTVVRCL